ncbi:MAG: hypothetical protein ACI8W1_002377, partial [Candidatus Azotimanducaceae bacterium]
GTFFALIYVKTILKHYDECFGYISLKATYIKARVIKRRCHLYD